MYSLLKKTKENSDHRSNLVKDKEGTVISSEVE